MGKWNWVFITFTPFLLVVSLTSRLLAGQDAACLPSKAEVMQKAQKLQMPFIANSGQTNEKVAFYAMTFGGTVFVTKDGVIVYSLPKKSDETGNGDREAVERGCQGEGRMSDLQPKSALLNSQSELKSLALKEELVGGKISKIKGEEEAITKVSYFVGNDTSKWKTNISTYDAVSLGEVYKGIELKLRAYGNNVEKLFYVKPGANPDQIRIALSGIQPHDTSFINGKQPPESPFIKLRGNTM